MRPHNSYPVKGYPTPASSAAPLALRCPQAGRDEPGHHGVLFLESCPSSGELNLLDFVGKDELFLELLDWPKTFPKVWGLGQRAYFVFGIRAPRPACLCRYGIRMNTPGRLNQEMELSRGRGFR